MYRSRKGRACLTLRGASVGGAMFVVASGRELRAQQPRAHADLGVTVETEAGEASAVQFTTWLYLVRVAGRDFRATQLRAGTSLRNVTDETRGRDVPFGAATLGLRSGVLRFDLSPAAGDAALAVGGDVGVSFAAPFETRRLDGIVLGLGRRAIWIPIIRMEVSLRRRLGKPDTPAAFSFVVAYVDRLSRAGTSIGLDDSFISGVGLEVWIP